jgi:tetratricopeptide (TPR) repeat protein
MADVEGILQSSMFWKRDVPVAPMMERALGYTGERRFVAFHWSNRLKSLCWADSPFGCARSGSKIWHRFLAHPIVAPHFQRWTADRKRVEKIHFIAKDGRGIDEIGNFSKDEEEEIARELGDAIFLDRQERKLYVVRWADAFKFLLFSYVHEEDVGKDDEEESAEREYAALQGVDWGDEPVPVDPAVERQLLDWLDHWLNDPDGLYLTAATHAEFRQFREAEKLLRQGLKLAPESGPFYYRLSIIYCCLHNWRKALEACDQAIRLDGSSDCHEYTSDELFMWRASFLARLKRYPEAIETYKQVLRLKPDEAKAYQEMGRCWTKLGRPAEAVDAHEHEVRLRMAERRNSPSNEQKEDELATAFAFLGQAYSNNGQDQEALWACEQAARHHPDGAKWKPKLAKARESLEKSCTGR